MRSLKKIKPGKETLETAENKDSEFLNKLISVIETNTDVITFLHNTKNKETAEKIIKDGFEFQSHLDYTTDVVSPKDPVTIKYFTIVRQAYGSFTMIIQISKHIIEDYSQHLDNLAHHFSEILSIKPPYLGPEEDYIYCLAPHFIKGYIDAATAVFYPNPDFNPSLKLSIFEDNLKKIIS